MKILLTGATGLVGKELGKKLIAQGHQVIAVTRSKKKAIKTLPYFAEVLEWDGEQDFPNHDLKDLDGVIHLMGENIADSRWTDEVKNRLVRSRVETTKKLKQSIMSCVPNLKFWIQGSAIGIYGSSDHEKIFNEQSESAKGFLSELCLDWENSLLEPAEDLKHCRKVILRTGVVLSHQGGALEKMMNPLLAGVGGVIGSGEQRMSVIHLNDLVKFILHAIDHESVYGVFNLVSHQPVSQKQFIESLCMKLGISSGLSVPAFAIKLALGEMGDLLLQDQAVVSTRLAESGFQLDYPHLDLIMNEVVSWHQNPMTGEKPAHLFYSEQFIAQPIEKVFEFFSSAENLEKITPAWLNFNIVKMSTKSIEKNTKIQYRLALHGIPFKWVTDIAVWNPPHQFVDQQLKGPYHLWYHEHSFESVPGGTLMKDWVRYQLPLGKMGMAGLPKVMGDVKQIFAYRTEIIQDLIN